MTNDKTIKEALAERLELNALRLHNVAEGLLKDTYSLNTDTQLLLSKVEEAFCLTEVLHNTSKALQDIVISSK